MSIVKRNPMIPSSSFFNDYLTKDLFDWSSRNEGDATLPRVNIVENNEEFKVDLAVPGMSKDDFNVELDNDLLTISAQTSHQKESNEENFTLKEFSFHSFKRSFYLPNTVDAEKIKGSYIDGILRLVVPKKEEAKKKPVKSISIN